MVPHHYQSNRCQIDRLVEVGTHAAYWTEVVRELSPLFSASLAATSEACLCVASQADY
jgi:hypothetical protein